jgi:uncharacterized protein involved in cysteine biosynthesis
MKRFSTRFSSGFWAPVRGWRIFLNQPDLWIWAAIPWILDVAILIGGWSLGFTAIQALTSWAIMKFVAAGILFNVLYYPALFILAFTFMVVWLILVMAISTLVASPFLAILAEKTLANAGAPVVGFANFGLRLLHILRMLCVSLLKAVVFAMAGITLFLASFIPGLNFAAVYGSMCLFAADVFDYSFEALGWGFHRRMRELRLAAPEVGGLGAGLALTSFLPGLTVLLLPLAVVGAAEVVADELRSQRIDL